MQEPRQSDAQRLRQIYNRRRHYTDYIRAPYVAAFYQTPLPVLDITICALVEIMSQYPRTCGQSGAVLL